MKPRRARHAVPWDRDSTASVAYDIEEENE
jgi:hypothetical protein